MEILQPIYYLYSNLVTGNKSLLTLAYCQLQYIITNDSEHDNMIM